MVGTCLDPPLWCDLREKEGRRTGWCERGDEEKLRACAIPPAPKDTVFTQVNYQVAIEHEELPLSDCSSGSPSLLICSNCPRTICS